MFDVTQPASVEEADSMDGAREQRPGEARRGTSGRPVCTERAWGWLFEASSVTGETAAAPVPAMRRS